MNRIPVTMKEYSTAMDKAIKKTEKLPFDEQLIIMLEEAGKYTITDYKEPIAIKKI